MGVDFYECETCGETTCDDNIEHVKIHGLGTYVTCRRCTKDYFEKTLDTGLQYDLLADHANYTFYAAPPGTKIRKDAVWHESSPNEILRLVEEAGYDPEECFFDCDFGDKDFDKEEEFTYDNNWCGNYETCFGEAYDTFESALRKSGKDVSDLGYELELVPSAAWKRLMRKQLDTKIENLQEKRRKLD
jgi:hypothetical protein